MTEEIALRVVEPTDAAQILIFMQQVNQETNFIYFSPEELTMDAAAERLALEAIEQAPISNLFVASKGQQIIGLLSLLNDESPGIDHIVSLGISVLKDFWGFGLGHALMDLAFEYIEAMPNIKRVTLEVQARNTRAIKLYKDYDFKVEGTLPAGFNDSVEGLVSVIVMGKLVNKD